MTDISFDGVDAINLYCDGGCEPNPGGIASFGWVIYERLENKRNGRRIVADWKVVADSSKTATNNYAEYCALGFAVRYLKDVGYRGSIYVHSDSRLLVHQVSGEWKCNKKHLQKLRKRIWEYVEEMGLYNCSYTAKKVLESTPLAEERNWFVLHWITRTQNAEADSLSTRARNEYIQQRDEADPDSVPMHCLGCNWRGTSDELDVDDDKESIVCPLCGTIGIVCD